MLPLEEFSRQPPEFWAVVKLVSQMLGYSERGRKGMPGRIKRYDSADVAEALVARDLDPFAAKEHVDRVAAYSNARAELLETVVEPNLMDREQAEELFEEIRARVDPPDFLLSMNKQKGDKRHYAFLACIVSMLTYEGLTEKFGHATFNPSPSCGGRRSSPPRAPGRAGSGSRPRETPASVRTEILIAK